FRRYRAKVSTTFLLNTQHPKLWLRYKSARRHLPPVSQHRRDLVARRIAMRMCDVQRRELRPLSCVGGFRFLSSSSYRATTSSFSPFRTTEKSTSLLSGGGSFS